MTRLELIAEIVKKMNQEMKEDNDRSDQRELIEDQEFSFEPHVIKLNNIEDM